MDWWDNDLADNKKVNKMKKEQYKEAYKNYRIAMKTVINNNPHDELAWEWAYSLNPLPPRNNRLQSVIEARAKAKKEYAEDERSLADTFHPKNRHGFYGWGNDFRVV